jgi:hypothetical protein
MPGHYRLTRRHTLQQLPKSTQMQAIHSRLALQFHPCAGHTIDHPTRNFQEPSPTILLQLHMHQTSHPLLNRSNQRHPQPKPRMPSITHLQLGTVSVLSCGCTTTSADT